jgi:hypothetical protein
MNGKKLNILGSFVLLLIIACNPMDYKEETVGEVDFSRYQDQLLSAQTEEQIKKVDSFIFKVIRDSSINRKLPKVWAEDLNGIKVNLSLLIDKPTLMVITSPYANWNTINLAREIPEAIKLAEGEKRVISLLLYEKAPPGAEIPPDFYKVQLEQLSALFPNAYLIRQPEAKKLNLYSLPSRYYFNEKGVLTHISHTALSYKRLATEVKNQFN